MRRARARPTCPIDKSAPFNEEDDFYCRLIALRDYIRSQNKGAYFDDFDWERIETADTFRAPESQAGILPYDPTSDYRMRMDTLSTRYSKP